MSERPPLDLATYDWQQKDGTYEMPGACSNCGSKFTLRIGRGYPVPGFGNRADCPNCGCPTIHSELTA